MNQSLGMLSLRCATTSSLLSTRIEHGQLHLTRRIGHDVLTRWQVTQTPGRQLTHTHRWRDSVADIGRHTGKAATVRPVGMRLRHEHP